MSHTYKDLGLVLFLRLLIFFQAQSLLLLRLCLCLISLDFLLFHDQFEHVVVFCTIFLFFLPCSELVYLPEQTLLFSFKLIFFADQWFMFWLPLFHQLSFFYLFFRTSQQDVLFSKYCLSKYNFLFHFFLLLPQKTFFYIGFTTSCRNNAAAEARIPIGNPLPLSFVYILTVFLFCRPVYQTPLLTDCFPFIPTYLRQFD